MGSIQEYHGYNFIFLTDLILEPAFSSSFVFFWNMFSKKKPQQQPDKYAQAADKIPKHIKQKQPRTTTSIPLIPSKFEKSDSLSFKIYSYLTVDATLILHSSAGGGKERLDSTLSRSIRSSPTSCWSLFVAASIRSSHVLACCLRLIWCEVLMSDWMIGWCPCDWRREAALPGNLTVLRKECSSAEWISVTLSEKAACGHLTLTGSRGPPPPLTPPQLFACLSAGITKWLTLDAASLADSLPPPALVPLTHLCSES